MRFVRNLFIVIGAVATFAILGGIVVALVFSARTPDVPDKTLLRLDLDRGLVEYVPQDPLAFFTLGRRGAPPSGCRHGHRTRS